jgi:hypothetical protein
MSANVAGLKRAKIVAQNAATRANTALSVSKFGRNTARLESATAAKQAADLELDRIETALRAAEAPRSNAEAPRSNAAPNASGTNPLVLAPAPGSGLPAETVVETAELGANAALGRPRSNATVGLNATSTKTVAEAAGLNAAAGSPPASGPPLILSATGETGTNAAAGSPGSGKEEAVVVKPVKPEKTATVKKYDNTDVFTPTADASQYKITPITSSSSSATSDPTHRTVACVKIEGAAPITMTETCYIATIQGAKTSGGKTAKSKKSKKRNTHKKK